MNDEELCYLSATALASEIRNKSLSPVQVVRAVLDRIERLNPLLNAFCTSMADQALQDAQQAESAVMQGEQLGPLHGVPVSVKDNIYVRGVRTTFGSRLMEHHVADVDAPCVQRLRSAGAIIIGRTNSPEFGWKGVTDNLVFGATRNPWNRDLTPGGSSGGASAAVASGLGPIGIGTDGGGSLRIPASFTGLVGHKPSLGRVPHYPGSSIGNLRHVGGLTRTVEDAALLLQVISGPDERDPCSLPTASIDYPTELSKGIEGLRIAYSPDLGYATVDPQMADHCERTVQTLTQAGAVVEPIELDWEDPYETWCVFFYGAASSRLGGILETEGDLLDPGLRSAVERANRLTGADFLRASQERYDFWLKVAQLFERFDLLVTPALAVLPFPVGQNNAQLKPGGTTRDLQWTQFTYPFNLTGQPAVSVPCGWSDTNLPIGLQIVGRRFADDVVLRAAKALEVLQPWADRRPSFEE